MNPTKKQPDSNLTAFFKTCRKTHSSSRGGTTSAEKSSLKSPSLPVFRLHHQDRKDLKPHQ